MSESRIAYVHLTLARLAGVEGAIAGQARAAETAGVPIEFVVVSPDREGREGAIRFVRIPEARGRLRRAIDRRVFKYRMLAQSGALDGVDVAVLRYVPAIDLDPLAIFRRSRARIVTVHHTKEAPELLSTGWTAGNAARAALETVGSPRVLSRAAGIVGVTDEIRDFQLAKLRRPRPAITVSNGIVVDRVPETGSAAPLSDGVEIAFVASAHAPWHGTDRLLAACERYRGAERVILHMVGQAAPSIAMRPSDRVRIVWHGEQRGCALDAIFARCSVAISSLAMHRAGLRQGAVLKTREYVARGIPFAYAYDDVDVPEDAEFALRLPAGDDPIDLSRVLELARRTGGDRELSRRMRAFAREHLDWAVKLRRLHAFAAGLAG